MLLVALTLAGSLIASAGGPLADELVPGRRVRIDADEATLTPERDHSVRARGLREANLKTSSLRSTNKASPATPAL